MIKMFISSFNNTYLRDRILGAFPKNDVLIEVLRNVLIAMLRDDKDQLTRIIESWKKHDLEPITHRELTYIKIHLNQAIKNSVCISPDICHQIIEKFEKLRFSIVHVHYIEKKKGEHELIERVSEGLKQIDNLIFA